MDIKKLRKDLGLTAKELADQLSVSASTIYYWENNPEKAKITEEKIKELVKGKEKVKLTIEVPELTPTQAKFMETFTLDTIVDKVSSMGYLNYVFKSNTTTNHYQRVALLGEWDGEVNELVELLGKAVLAGKWTTKETMYYMVKLPSGHYLCKYKGEEKERYGYSVEKNYLTVKTKTKDELKDIFPQYVPFIVYESFSDTSVFDNQKTKRGFMIREKISQFSETSKTKEAEGSKPDSFS